MVTTKLQDRYQQEREKRINIKGLSQYLDNSKGSLYALNVDPWVPTGTTVHHPVPDGGHVRVAIFGAGFGGICAAIRCLEGGIVKTVNDILIVDPAGGFGGTWWWNRFPGLMCDIESYCYLPRLEETGYMPKRKYASGEEIREYADLLAGKTLTWDNDHWTCNIVTKAKGLPLQNAKITADFVILASGTFTYPKLPNLPGLDTFSGKMIHTARWDYSVTGGTQSDPILNRLKDKRVAFVGTGATAIQAIPEVAKYAKELYVFQRTPSAVDVRDNRNTDPGEWRDKIANKKGWQEERSENFQAFVENAPPEMLPKEDLVHDGWTSMPTIGGAYGSRSPYTAEEVAKFLEQIQEADDPRSERVRQRVLDVVKDPETAKNLQAWYAGWCKRPCFHDEYLPAFNRSSVHLVDTGGKGVEALTQGSIVANGKEYPVDIIIWGTGYGSPLTDSLAGKAEMNVIGKSGLDMDKAFKEGEVHTLHGIMTNNFPNLFSLGLSQAGVGANQNQRLDAMSKYVAHTIDKAIRKAGVERVIIEPSKVACEKWGDQVASHAYLLAGMGGCTPSYFTLEGDIDRMTPEQGTKVARSTLWGRGYTEYSRIIEDWQARGQLEGLNITVAG